MRVGSLCSGAGGLDMAVESVFSAKTVWHCEINDAASKVLAVRWPGVPNYRDLTTTDWSTVEPIEILTGGYPCQPFSYAGQRKGTDDERHIWPYVREAIRHLRPRYTFMENVAGHRSLGLDRVLGDLAEDGLHVQWVSVRAADVGAAHSRERLFMLVTDPSSSVVGQAESVRVQPTGWAVESGECSDDDSDCGESAADAEGASPRGGVRPGGIPHQPGGSYRFHPEGSRTARHSINDYGPFADAVRRWESISGLVAPAPAELTSSGRVMVSPAFAEFLMGWPPGWVTAIPGLTSEDQLRICGNGVVPHAAEAALRYLLTVSEVAA